MKNGFAAAPACVLCVVMAGCYTPQPVRDLATKGVGATNLAEAELQRYLAAAQDSLSARLVIVRQTAADDLEESYSTAFTRYLHEKAGQKSGDDLLAVIRDVGEQRRRGRNQKATALTTVDEAHKKALGDAIPVRTDAFATSRKAFSALAQELTPQEWLELTGVYAQAIQTTLKKVKEDEKKAKEEAAKTVKPAPQGPAASEQ
jgi:hypothetical protein